MAGENGNQPAESGFELNGEFYRWHVSDLGKDLMLIDRFSGMPVSDFFEVADDALQRGRAPIMLALIATSIRAEHPDWTIERIVQIVLEVHLGEVVFIGAADEEARPELPPQQGEDLTGASSSSPSRSPRLEVAPARSGTSSGTPA